MPRGIGCADEPSRRSEQDQTLYLAQSQSIYLVLSNVGLVWRNGLLVKLLYAVLDIVPQRTRGSYEVVKHRMVLPGERIVHAIERAGVKLRYPRDVRVVLCDRNIQALHLPMGGRVGQSSGGVKYASARSTDLCIQVRDSIIRSMAIAIKSGHFVSPSGGACGCIWLALHALGLYGTG